MAWSMQWPPFSSPLWSSRTSLPQGGCSRFPVPQPSLSLLSGDHGTVKGEQLLLCHSHNTPGMVQPYSLPLLALGTGKK